MIHLAKYLKPFTWMILGTILLLFLQAFGDLALPRYLAMIVNSLGMEELPAGFILNTGLIMLAITLLTAACAVGVGLLSARTAAALARNMRKDLFQKVESFSSTEFDHFSTASLITRTTNDITQVQMFVLMTLRMVFFAPIVGVGGIILALNTAASMWWIIAVGVAMLLGLVAIVFSLTLPRFQKMQSL
ncbi:MAG: ABC transporter ATP-binding protein, partial [Chloroflexi bacterium]